MKQSQPPGTPVEHDYMGGSSFSHLHQQDQKVEKEAADHDDDVGDEKKKEILKGTELRLGLPDSSSYYSSYSTRKEESRGYPLLSLGLPFVSSSSSGAKRVFSDAIVGGGGGGSAGDNGGEVVGGMGGRELLLFSHNNTPAISSIGKDNHTPQKQQHHHQKQQKEDITTNRKKKDPDAAAGNGERPAAGKAQVIGWPPVRNYRKNSMVANPSKSDVDAKDKHGSGSLYVKVSMDGAPYLRKVDLRTYSDYKELSIALEKMFSCFSIGHCGPHAFPSKDGFNATDLLDGSELVLTFEDKDGDWMLVGDVPWDMFTGSCKRLRIMKGSKAIGLAPRVNNKGQNKELAPKLAT